MNPLFHQPIQPFIHLSLPMKMTLLTFKGRGLWHKAKDAEQKQREHHVEFGLFSRNQSDQESDNHLLYTKHMTCFVSEMY